jgi:hypothetical protein
MIENTAQAKMKSKGCFSAEYKNPGPALNAVHPVHPGLLPFQLQRML